MSQTKFYTHTNKLSLENGSHLPEYRLAYQTFGKLNAAKDNIVWIVHALTANSDPTDWWADVVGAGKSIDPAENYIICANVLGSHYGSTNAFDFNPETGKKYHHDFPMLTTRDLAKTYEHLAHYLGLTSIKLLIGASMGGQQAMEWAISSEIEIQSLLLIATNAKHSPYGIAFNESQRMAIELDPTWVLNTESSGLNGMRIARSIALISYRSAYGYNSTQEESESDKIDSFKASSYQQYQGLKLAKRFNAYSYHLFTRTMDSHNVGRGRKSIANALSLIKAKTTVVGISSDLLFTIQESQELYSHIPNSELIIIDSDLGHDGFLTESHKMNEIILKTLTNTKLQTA